MTRIRLVCCCVLLAGCALKKAHPMTPEPDTLGLPLTVDDDARICIQETPERWSCLTVDELRQVIATLKRL